jgi:hypothetical protein
MPVAAEQGHGVLARQGRNPDVVPGYRVPAAFQFVADLGVSSCRSFVHDQEAATGEHFG